MSAKKTPRTRRAAANKAPRLNEEMLTSAVRVIDGGCKVGGGAQVVEALLKKKMLVEALDSASVLAEWATSLLLASQRLQNMIRERIEAGKLDGPHRRRLDRRL